MTFLLKNSNEGVLLTQTPVHDSRCCKRLFSCLIARGSPTNPNSSAWLQMLQTTFLLSISKRGLLPTQTPVHDSRLCKGTFSCPLARGNLTHPNSSAWLEMLQTTSFLPISWGKITQTQTQLHDSRYCKRILSCPLERGEFYQLKVLCMTLDVANKFYPSN